MTIGIITFHRAHNYGAVLQCYALKKALEKLGYKVDIIDYWPKYRDGMYDQFDFRYLRLDIPLKLFIRGNGRSFVYSLLNYFERKKKIIKFNKFIEDMLDLNAVPSEINWSEKNQTITTYLFGSDQIWRNFDYPGIKGIDEIYWGEFDSHMVKKVAYAASMGKKSDYEKIDKLKIKKLLQNFAAISVRESTLSLQLSEVVEVIPQVVLDPVFLLKKSDWLFCFKDVAEFRKSFNYVLLYNISRSKVVEAFARSYAKEKNLKILILTADSSPFDMSSEYIDSPGPIDFLKYLYHADFIITSSFHGVAFSLLFEKEFYSMGMNDNSSRVESLLDIVGLESRYLNSCSENQNVLNIKKIDYNTVTKKIHEYSRDSLRYLVKNLK